MGLKKFRHQKDDESAGKGSLDTIVSSYCPKLDMLWDAHLLVPALSDKESSKSENDT